MPTTRSSQRLFFALFPPQPAGVRRAAAQAAAKAGATGEVVVVDRLHVTLAFVASAPVLQDEMIAGALAVGAATRHAPVSVRFDQIQSFAGAGRSRPIVLTSHDGNAGANFLNGALLAALAADGVQFAAAHAYAPHMTLMYDEAHIEPVLIPTISWEANRFALVRSITGQPAYDILATWPLR